MTTLLERYAVDAHAYGYCPECMTVWDYWKYGETDYKCPSCDTPLKELSEADLEKALADCQKDKCFTEQMLHKTPLRPILTSQKHMESYARV